MPASKAARSTWRRSPAIERSADIDPEIYNDTNRMRLYVFANDRRAQALLVAVYDNLGKGASGAAVQNLDLMLGG